MRYPQSLIEGRLVRRYMRFLADVMVDGKPMTVHCPNSGSMDGLKDEGNLVRISGPHSATRKYRYTLEQIQVRRPDGRRIWVGINTMVPNIIAREAAEAGRLPGLEMYRQVRREVMIGEHSRIDLRLDGKGLTPCWVEVKNVTLVLPDPHQKANVNQGNIAAFPDAVTTRGAKHLRELVRRAEMNERAVMLYVIQRSDGEFFAPAVGYDLEYAKELARAEAAGVAVMPFKARITTSGIWLGKPCPRIIDK